MFTLPRLLIAGGIAAAGFIATAAPVAAGDQNCTGTLTNARFDNVIVPAGAACTLINSTVTGNVVARSGAYFQAGNTTVRGNVSAQGAQTIFIDLGSKVNGNIQVENTAQLYVFGSVVSGNLDARRASTAVQVCGSTIQGNLKVQESRTDILIGDPLTVDCPGNTVAGNVALEDNVTDVELVARGNIVRGNMRVFNNRGPSVKVIQDNRGGGTLECTQNAAPFVGTPNPGWAHKRGQCT